MKRSTGWRPTTDQRPQFFSNFPFRPVEAGKKHAAPAVESISYYRAILQLEVQCRCDQLGRNLEQFLRQRDEFLGRETAMPFVHRLSQRERKDAARRPARQIIRA